MLSHINAFINFLELIINTVFWTIPLILISLLKSITPFKACKKFYSNVMHWISENWIAINNAFFSATHTVEWKIDGVKNLNQFKSYFIISNHQSWVDILVLQKIFNRRIPFPRFFIKKQLHWIPFLGQAFQALDFPAMNRYSKDYLKKYPEKKGKDMLVTQQACRKIAKNNVSLINFLEGTRFTDEKHRSQKSPFNHHLKPKAGGLAFALEAFEGKINTLLDVTIIYSQKNVTLWSYLRGQVPKIVVSVKERVIPKDLLEGDYSNDPQFKEKMQNWVNQIWIEKDMEYNQLVTANS